MHACIRSVALESCSVQGQMILKFFEDKRAFVYVVNRVIRIDAWQDDLFVVCDLLCDQLLHSCDVHFAHLFSSSLFKCPDLRIKWGLPLVYGLSNLTSVKQYFCPGYVRCIRIGLDKFGAYKIQSILRSVRDKIICLSGSNHVLVPMLFNHSEQVGFILLSTRY
jgi:hypothetical protein